MRKGFSRRAVVLLAMLSTPGGIVEAQRSAVRPNQDQLVIVVNHRGMLQSALDAAGAAGLHIVFGHNQAVFLNRIQALGAPGEYRAIREGGSDNFERALNAAAQQGFRIVPATLTRSSSATVAVMQRQSAESPAHRYRVLAVSDEFQQRVRDLLAKGFSIVGVFTQQSGIGAVVGRPGRLHVVFESAGDSPPSDDALAAQFRVVSNASASTMEKELNQAGAEGYRVIGGSFMNVLLVKTSTDASLEAYRVFGAIRQGTLSDEVAHAAREGYRVVPSAIMSNPGSRAETVIVMEETPPNARRYEYSWSYAPNVNRNRVEPPGSVPVGLARLGIFGEVMVDDFGNEPEHLLSDYYVLYEAVR